MYASFAFISSEMVKNWEVIPPDRIQASHKSMKSRKQSTNATMMKNKEISISLKWINFFHANMDFFPKESHSKMIQNLNSNRRRVTSLKIKQNRRMYMIRKSSIYNSPKCWNEEKELKWYTKLFLFLITIFFRLFDSYSMIKNPTYKNLLKKLIITTL